MAHNPPFRWPRQHAVLRGADHPHAVLDEATVTDLKALLAAGASDQEAADGLRFLGRPAISRTHVSNIRRGLAWRHVPWPAGFDPATIYARPRGKKPPKGGQT